MVIAAVLHALSLDGNPAHSGVPVKTLFIQIVGFPGWKPWHKDNYAFHHNVCLHAKV